MDAVLSVRQLAKFLDVSPRTLEGWRQKGTGPAWVKLGGLIRYRQSDVDHWIQGNSCVMGAVGVGQ